MTLTEQHPWLRGPSRAFWGVSEWLDDRRAVARRALGLWIGHGGFRFACPLCGGRWRRMLPRGLGHAVIREKAVVGLGVRRNAECPRCRSMNRERFLYLYARDKLGGWPEGALVLHMAPEPALSDYLRNKVRVDYISADLEPGRAMVAADIMALPFESDRFDRILCSHVLEHIPDDRKAMRELHRVLKPGGTALIMVPLSYSIERTLEDAACKTPEARGRAYGQEDHLRLYGPDFPDRLAEAGFRVSVERADACFQARDVRRYALLPEEPLFVCSK